MKIIGVEFRLGMEGFRDLEVFCKELDIVFPIAVQYVHEPKYSFTIHTSRGDVNDAGRFSRGAVLDTIGTHNGPIDDAALKAAWDSLQKQVERIKEGAGHGGS
jgi:hypothetical protein